MSNRQISLGRVLNFIHQLLSTETEPAVGLCDQHKHAVRYAYKNGDLKATGEAQKLITDLPSGRHSTRNIVFSKDGKSLFLTVVSASNNNDNGAASHCANILEYTPEGEFVGVYASGIRNPVSLAINPETGELWTSVNERDNLVPDYLTHVVKGGFYGRP